jgi:hypothetical protein
METQRTTRAQLNGPKALLPLAALAARSMLNHGDVKPEISDRFIRAAAGV